MLNNFALSQLLALDDFAVQCHDAPDADSIATAYAVYTYLRREGKNVKIIYSGKREISKPNLMEMIVRLNIPIRYVPEGNVKFSTLVITDGQYGAGNVTCFSAEKVIVIDHHVEENPQFDMGVINSGLGSCATLAWDLLRKENFPFAEYPDVCTALYYGLFTDTANLSEIYHPLDKDMRDSLVYNKSIVKRLQNTNLSLDELAIAGGALINCTRNQEHKYAIFKSEPCDPNILGFISDLALQVDGVDTCVVYNIQPEGAKFSVRCCARDVMASDFAEYLTRGVGAGGGHLEKAGGFISKTKLAESGLDGQNALDSYIHIKIPEYFNAYDIIDSDSHTPDTANMGRYKKRKLTVGFARSLDMFEAGTPVLIRALEGEEKVIASEGIYFMVGILGEIYPIEAATFRKKYAEANTGFDIKIKDLSYSPNARNINTGEVKELAEFIKPCIPLGETEVFAQPLKKYTKVFTRWNTDSYMYGREGDYLTVRADALNDVYIIRGDIFALTYEAVSPPA